MFEVPHVQSVDDDVRESFPSIDLRCLQSHAKGWLDKLLHIVQNCVQSSATQSKFFICLFITADLQIICCFPRPSFSVA